MYTYPDRFNNGFDSKVLNEIKNVNEKLKKEKNPEEREKLLMQQMCLGFNLNAGFIGQIRGGFYPY